MSAAAPLRQEPLSTCTVTPLTAPRLVAVAAGSVPLGGSLVEVVVPLVVVAALVVEVAVGVGAAARRPAGASTPRNRSTAQNRARKTTNTAAARAVGPGRNLTSLSVVRCRPAGGPARARLAARRRAGSLDGLRAAGRLRRGDRLAPRHPRGTGGALPAEPLDQHWVRREGRRVVDQPAEELIIGGGADPELTPDGLFLRTRILPPLPLEGEDGPVALWKRSCRRLGHGWAPP